MTPIFLGISGLVPAPDSGQGALNLLFEALHQFPVGIDQRLLGFNFGDDGLLGGKGWERD